MSAGGWMTTFDAGMGGPGDESTPIESESRRPTFRPGTTIRLADGDDWHLPPIDPILVLTMPRLARLIRDLPGLGEPPRSGPPTPEDRERDIEIALKAALLLLVRNYAVDPVAIGRLLRGLSPGDWVRVATRVYCHLAGGWSTVLSAVRADVAMPGLVAGFSRGSLPDA